MRIVIDDAEAVAALERLQAETGRDANTIVRDLLRDRMSRPSGTVHLSIQEREARLQDLLQSADTPLPQPRHMTEAEKAERTRRIRAIQKQVRERLGGETFDHADVVGYDENGLPT
ncbi:hypothetical protein C882_2466 [Caenispirillum salinarum AK4]|uniref:Uncharacterized protein n=1 Tax=Caenispirillum salinarum AK4 TaxID=1238182 RepID=K9H481_9PROT|nr:hypothetical protein [Caenispirillum salinarum]EKV32387.1 hypothetical protein C882_2466 [Caenispirillum salinarum AK4]